MGEILDEWCAKATRNGNDSSHLVSLLDQARFNLHAKAIRDMNDDAGSTISAPLEIRDRGSGASSSQGSSTLRVKGNKEKPHSTSANGLTSSSRNNDLHFFNGDDLNGSNYERRSDGGTEEGSDSSSFFGHLPSLNESFNGDSAFRTRRSQARKQPKHFSRTKNRHHLPNLSNSKRNSKVSRESGFEEDLTKLAEPSEPPSSKSSDRTQAQKEEGSNEENEDAFEGDDEGIGTEEAQDHESIHPMDFQRDNDPKQQALFDMAANELFGDELREDLSYVARRRSSVQASDFLGIRRRSLSLKTRELEDPLSLNDYDQEGYVIEHVAPPLLSPVPPSPVLRAKMRKPRKEQKFRSPSKESKHKQDKSPSKRYERIDHTKVKPKREEPLELKNDEGKVKKSPKKRIPKYLKKFKEKKERDADERKTDSEKQSDLSKTFTLRGPKIHDGKGNIRDINKSMHSPDKTSPKKVKTRELLKPDNYMSEDDSTRRLDHESIHKDRGRSRSQPVVARTKNVGKHRQLDSEKKKEDTKVTKSPRKSAINHTPFPRRGASRSKDPSVSPKKSPKKLITRKDKEMGDDSVSEITSKKSSSSKISSEKSDSGDVRTRSQRSSSLSPRKTGNMSDYDRRRYYFSKYGTWRELQRLSKANMKKAPVEEDNLREDIEKVLGSVDYLDKNEKKSYEEALFQKIRGDKYLNSLCMKHPEYLHCAVHVFTSFGTDVHVQTRTQLVLWYALERLRRFWILGDDPIPSSEDILANSNIMDFVRNVSKLCFNVMATEQIHVTGILENDRRRKRVVIVFKNFGVRISKKQLATLGIVKTKETGNFIEVHFLNSLLIDFLGVCHAHISDEEINELGKNKLISCLPFFCGLAGASHRGKSRAEAQKSTQSQFLITKFIDSLTGLPPTRDPDYYLRFLQNLWMETQQTFLNCVFEARLRDIYIYPPPGDKQIVLALHTLHMHDVIPLAYYLDNIDKEKVQLEGLMMQECNMDDNRLRIFGKNVWSVKKVQITGNYFTQKGLHDITRHLRGNDSLRIRSLDLSDSNIDDDALAKLNPILPYLEELCLSDNFFTWYGLRKIVQPHKRTKKLKRLEMSRCNLNEHAFYELIPMILRTDHVILEGNNFTPLELKIFARQVRECQSYRLDTLVLNSCSLDDECLYEIAKFAFRIPNLHLQNNIFGTEGVKALTRMCKKHEMGQMKSLNMRGCKLNSEHLVDLADIIPHLESITLSNNNFSGADGAKMLASKLDEASSASTADFKIKFIDLRHCRLVESCKKSLSDVCKKNKVDIKMW